MKKILKNIMIASLMASSSLLVYGQSTSMSDVKFKFYGRIRADLFYNSRANNETVDGLFYMYPKDHAYDADGNDLNSTPQGNMYMLYTRLGVDIGGMTVGKAKASAKVEVDFRGSGTTYAMPRIRHAYINLDFGKSSWLIGQTWHPMFGEIFPSVLNLSTGAPFQPFNRSPQIRYRHKISEKWLLTASAIWQQQYTSAGPEGKSHNYLKNGCIPELYAGIDYAWRHFEVGAGVEFLSLKPRQRAELDGKIYKVDERVTSLSADLHMRYRNRALMISGKTVLANNLTQASMLGGFGVTSTNAHTGECTYTPFRHSMSWLNITYGKKWQPGIFIGYLKNLGTGKAISGPTYGVGLDVDQQFSLNYQLTYNLSNWKFGVELSSATAWYGTMDKANGKIVDTHSVTNYRALAVMMLIF